MLKSGEILNILDAHADNRFNPEIDKKMNYTTKTILTAPIFNQNNDIIIGILK